ncbi:MAG: extracellular solute-binding protein [Alphaproteobacteria bacterium]|jgi:spermidine/putrescine transport system substrate-binding protein|nr:extracellular solute-binding protein [Alphaproteobacteria bacterium]
MTVSRSLLGASVFALAASAAFAEDPELLVFDWSGFEEDAYWAVYASIHGQGPTYAFFGEEEEAFQKLRSGFRADVAHPCPHSVDKWRQAGLIEPWDLSKIPNYASVADEFKTAPVITDGDDVYMIPADNGATAIAWNTEEVPAEDVATLQVFANPDYAGRISLPDNVDDVFALGYLATGTTDWTTATMEDMERAAAWIREVHPNVRTYWTDGAELAQLMATGEVLVAWSWNETPVQMSAEGHPIAFNRSPAEGTSMWFCGYVNLVDGPGSEDKAHDFINAFLDPSVTDYIVNEWGYGHGNAAAMAGLGADTLEEVGLGPVDVPILQQLPMDISLREAQVREFENIKAGF